MCAVRTSLLRTQLTFATESFGKVNAFSFILAVALSTVVSLLIIGLMLGVMYYRWRTRELMGGIKDFIERNWKLEKEINQLLKNNQLNK